jgi:hypothetical protein
MKYMIGKPQMEPELHGALYFSKIEKIILKI